jgi:hypothetical protein
LVTVLIFAACAGGGEHAVVPGVITTPDPASGGLVPSPRPSSSPSAGTSAPKATATPPATSGPAKTANVPRHIATWAYDEYLAQGQSASSAQVQTYVTYAEGGAGNGKAVSDCGSSSTCASVFYFNPNLIHDCSSTFVAQASENWYVHESGYNDAAHRVRATEPQSCNGASSYPVYAANGANPAVQSFFLSYLHANADSWNYYFMDDTEGTVVDQFYGPSGGMCGGSFCTATEEQPTNASVVSAHSLFANSMNHTNGAPMMFFYNGLAFDGAQTPNDLTVLSSSSHFSGAVCENCVVDNGVFRPSMYGPVLNAMTLVNHTSGGKFVELNNGTLSAGISTLDTERLVTIAIAWLGFSPNHTVVWANLEDDTNNLAVWPEELLYPTQPVQSMSSGASDIAVAPGVWRREFAACYNDGAAIGQCAALLNSSSSPVVVGQSWLSQSYGHVISLLGGDILSGGSVRLSATAFNSGANVVPAGGAVLLSR